MCGGASSECGASCLLNGASCLLNVGRVVLGQIFFGASCLGLSCSWGELSVILFNMVLINTGTTGKMNQSTLTHLALQHTKRF